MLSVRIVTPTPTPTPRGDLVLFESWLRHRVPPNQGVAEGGDERVSVSFNYHDRMGARHSD